jgi:hypothetical protein
MLEATVRKQASQLNQVKKQRLGEHDLISDEIVDDTVSYLIGVFLGDKLMGFCLVRSNRRR